MYLLCKREEPVIRQTQKGAACQNYFQDMVKFLETHHLLLQINRCAQVIALQINKVKLRTLIQKQQLTK